MSRCEEFLRSRDHVDLDVSPAQLWEHQWEQFLTEYYSITQGGAKIQVISLVCTEPVELETKVKRRFAKISQSQRRPLLGPSAGLQHLLLHI